MSYRIALATAAAYPDLDDDGRLVLDALRAAGHTAEPVVWDDASIEWEDYDAVVLRGTWDYSRRYDDFLGWMWKIKDKALALNQEPLVRYYADKRYLRDYESEGVDIVPTQFVTVHDPTLEHDYLGVEHIVRPSISGGLLEARRFGPGDAEASKAELEKIKAAGKTAMISPYVESDLERSGVSLIYLDGEFSHAVARSLHIAPDSDPSDELRPGEDVVDIEPTEGERRLADFALSRGVTESPLYARVDLIRTPKDAPWLIEVQLVEPVLFLGRVPGLAEKFAGQIVARIEKAANA
ncbi:hypothetical protein P0W64_19665 [Tsukamurella sp. 8F]|uniref:ATP-grasp domain-containing protein n=1 Tax=unclassified Tsukamurella TaxID=2633480 RepID=UPI0023BA2605|nr:MULTISPECIES: hypothetical protein [unclassified Tsukamurella]MDF0532291.1 hypothetical protein [Tsukamurella sp. 8J]MDF0589006.1 hypothetical protein [Tsukamurella sp. 8F]